MSISIKLNVVSFVGCCEDSIICNNILLDQCWSRIAMHMHAGNQTVLNIIGVCMCV